MEVTVVGFNEFRVEYKGDTWYVNYCEETSSCNGGTPEQYWDTEVETELFERVGSLYSVCKVTMSNWSQKCGCKHKYCTDCNPGYEG
jgi:hypothetical protein